LDKQKTIVELVSLSAREQVLLHALAEKRKQIHYEKTDVVRQRRIGHENND